MNLFDFQVFKCVAHFQSISLAAKKLHMTQPAITHIINKLEKKYSLTLFDRSRQGTILTDNGMKILTCVNQLLMDYENLEHTALALKNKNTYRIVLATYPSVTLHCLSECLESEIFDQNQYVLAIREGGYQEVVEWLATGEADFSISVKEDLIPGFHYQLISNDPYVVVSPTSIPANLTIADVKNHPFIMPLSGCKEVLEPYLTANNIFINKVMESETISSTLAFILQFNGLTIVPLSSLHKQITNNFNVQPLEINIKRQLIMQWSPKKDNDTLFKTFIDNLLSQLQKRVQEMQVHIQQDVE
ncbi:LysR family transcriptional regulator [Bacillus cereus]|uniref:LysR family transcriptional regulator n=1 Tax=Bacillus thuringiensis TaxID=1428 RepID=UPI00044643F8|nr:LysR family transcriptional regulator [Bacillus thuringiensis]MEB8637034.1 LysR family transcriptional regulator [Bacillus cereus]EXY06085.1 LysR family transcriptional regulator [Bacillus thuringiensis]MEB8743414.1 LysR family transcriptional regulator [Bacillus cereus]MEB8798714.1 LysR family transcriptional regulator [Bacillus cereus]MEB8810853.1 LysR family transcriptional regulator [Bacillus cereus]